MKKTKRFLLGTTLAGALIASAGFGTYSWFTSETQAKGAMENGTLQINDGKDITTPIFSGEKFAPSQLQYGEWLTLKNSGDLDTYLKATLSQSVDKASLDGYKIGFIAMKYTTKPDEDVFEASKINLEKLFKGPTNERSVAVQGLPKGVEAVSGILTDDQVKAAADSETIKIGQGNNEGAFWELKENQYMDIMFGIKLDAKAGNEYQGAKYNATLKVKAKQTEDGSTYGG
ncbi:spore coat-associated protein N [Scopulibacillus darangshiensis]|uniref:Spore coat-associated protein N n=1 Tax=Scopulibacillus darangshiensis TaxID=442528 RepID=A0A4R2PA20_9BACL|nr:hypothetical protein [Scopulibacillus darangshiensis]TCP30931.1 spore coat-associated protein N [Scopulibacillus darangshiensis]